MAALSGHMQAQAGDQPGSPGLSRGTASGPGSANIYN